MSEFDENNNLNENESTGSADNGYTPQNDANDSNGECAQNGTPAEDIKNDTTHENAGSNEKPQYPYGNTAYGANPYQNADYRQNNYSDNQQYNNQNNGYYQSNSNPYQQGYNGGYPYSDQNPDRNRQTGYAYPQGANNIKEKKGKGKTVFLAVIIVILVGVIAALAISLSNKGDNGTYEIPGQSSTTEKTSENMDEFTSNSTPEKEQTTSVTGGLSSSVIYEKVLQSSVGVLVYDSTKSLSSEGTGVLFSEDTQGKYTYIVTCAHVISDAQTIMIELYDGKEYPATIIGYDTKTDIGVCKIEASGLQIAEFGDSSKLNVGDVVYAIGNPGGTEFANSFTNGMVSAIDRPVSSSSTGYTMECIQHTAAINPGNSGGALVNEFGQVIGINSMKIVASDYEGMGFSVPSSVFIDIVNQIVENGHVANRPMLGITYLTASNQQTYAIFVAANKLPSGSVIIYQIAENSAFNGTDVQKGDMIVAVNGQELDDPDVLTETIENSKVGDKIKLKLIRINKDYSYKEFTVEVALVEDSGNNNYGESQTETTTSLYEYYFGGGNGSSGGSSPYDFFGDFGF